MPKHEKTVELIVTTTTIAALAVIVFFGSAYGARGLSEIYGNTQHFSVETFFAVTAYRWTPFLFTALIIVYLWLRISPRDFRWASWCALSLAALTTAVVLYGIVLPFASTTFSMSTH